MRKTPRSSSEFWQDFFHGHVTKREPCKIIENRTAWRIVIFHLAAPDKTGGQATQDGQLILPYGWRS